MISKLLFLPALFITYGTLAGTGDTTELNMVTVTSGKIHTEDRETSQIIRVIDRETLQMSSAKDLSQVLMEEAGIIINGAMSNPGLNKSMYLQGASAEFTLFLIDGIPLNDPSLLAGNFDLRLIPLNQIERIEILTGSQSVLYGSDAIGGVINIITKRASADFSANAMASYGNLNSLRASLGVYQKITPKLEYVLDLQSYLTDGISEAAVPPTQDGDFQKDGLDQHSGQLKLKWSHENLELEPFLRVVDHKGDYDNGAFQDAENRFESAISNMGLNMRYQAEPWQFRLTYSRTVSQRSFFYTDWMGDAIRDDFKGRADNLDAFAALSWGNDSRILIGTLFQNMQMTGQGLQETDPSYEQISPYITYFTSFFEDFFVDLGTRFSSNTAFGSNLSYNATFGWRNDRVKAFISRNTGFKTPTLSQLFGQWGANPELDPQISANTELGVSWWISSDLNSELKAFQRDITALIIYDGVLGYINAHEQSDHGIEWALGWDFLRHYRLQTIYAYVDGSTRLDSADDVQGLIRRPKHRFQMDVTARYERISFRLGVLWNAERLDKYFDPATFLTEVVIMDPYFLINSYVEYTLLEERLHLFLDMKNMTGTNFMEIYGYNGLPLTFTLGARFQW